MSLPDLTILELRERLTAGELSAEEAVRGVAEDAAARDAEIGGYLGEIDVESAVAEARNSDLAKPLGGVPVAIKDLINVRGQPCSCASKLLAGAYTSPYNAGVIRKLREAGAIPLGRTNMDEFAMGSSTENSGLQITRNPWDRDRIPGGSSGGSAAVVAAGSAVAALGTDTGGSIRQPAALCGCVGLKPSYGRVSRYGVVAFASSLDQVGPMTKTVADSALLLEAISGKDAADSTSLDAPVPNFSNALNQGVNGLRIGIPKEYFEADGADEDVLASVRDSLQALEAEGAELVEVSLPHTEYAVATYYVIATAEASANLARFDTVRYGNRQPSEDLLGMYFASRSAGFGEEVKRRIILGTYVLSSGYYDAYYLRAQKTRTLIRRDFQNTFENVDVIASPTSPVPAFKIGERSESPLEMYLADIYTISANLAGICGISIPCGTVERDGNPLPTGLQFLAPSLGESTLLQVASQHEAINGFKGLNG